MRKFHRWLSVLFGVVLLWIAASGVMIQLADLKAAGEPRPATAAVGFVCPPDMNCRPKLDPNGAKAWAGWLKELHSGEEFGPVGTVISILGGFSLIFFAVSGLWMYIRMWSHRRDKNHKPAWFWK